MENKNPFFSIILSTFQEEENIIKRSVDSILNQSFNDFELIIIKDDPSRSSGLFINLLNFDKRVVLLKNKTNLGLTISLNKAIELSNGKFIARQDADDFSNPDRLKNAYNFIVKNNCNIYQTPYLIRGQIFPNYFQRFFFNQKKLRYKNFFAHGSLIIRSKIIKELKYDSKFKFSQDFELYNRLLDYGYIIYYDKKNISYNITNHKNQISNLYKKEQLYFHNLVLKRNKYQMLTLPIFKTIRVDIILDLLYAIKK